MIKVIIADNQPVVRFGIKSYFKNHSDVSISGESNDFSEVLSTLKNKDVDVLVLDLELEGLKSVNVIKAMVKDHPKTKILIFTNLSETMYAPNLLKTGVAGFIHKTESLESLESAIINASKGEVVFSELVKRNIAMAAKLHKSERLYRKLSTRELEVLRYLSAGKKNHEISEILGLNEKTISTYKLRLLNKLNVTNLVDLVNKAKTLDIV
ncbi:response regulator transcription factor [Flavobacterium soli]|uniref:response regulator transcription factor n=1 Tax=Flavobacterium soli TaxID=344881 RepID=UPI0004162D9D|nr:response regulator transcription factor [Flavobacterium soli]